MNKVEELIRQLCPEGVEYKRLDEIFTISRGRVISKEYLSQNSGKYPVYSSQTANNGQIGKIATYDYNGEYLTWTTDGANAGTIFYRNEQFSITNVCGLLKANTINVVPKFAYYVLSVVMKSYVSSGMGNPKLMSNVVAKIQIPIPPLPVQQEIVNILDTFTQLEAELEAELEARKTQYEYYRNELLTFGDEVEWKTLGDICDIYDGTHQTPKYTNSGVPFVSVQNINNIYGTEKYISLDDFNKYKYKPRKDDLFMTRIGDIGTCALVENDDPLAYYVTLTLIRMKHRVILPRFLKHIIESNIGKSELYKRTLVNAVPIKINLGDIGKITIPIPPLAEQERIAGILDKFDALVNDISIGLPAEIEARRKQYEYYREKLLSFDRAE